MTIKQQGGVFGRNPSFNDVEMNKLDVDGVVIDPSSSAYFYAVNDDPANKNMFDLRTAEGGGFRLGATTGANPTHWVQTFFDEPLEVRIGGTSPTFTFEKTGNATIENGNLIIGTSGKGIDFSATAGTGTSELFDDYEEGSFEPSVAGTSTAGSGTYNSRSGRYVKVGQMVYAEGWINMTAHSGSGNLKITGLPYASFSSSTAIRPVPFYVSTLTVTSGAYVIGRINNSSTEILLYEVLAGSASAIPLDTNFVAAFSATYYAA